MTDIILGGSKVKKILRLIKLTQPVLYAELFDAYTNDISTDDLCFKTDLPAALDPFYANGVIPAGAPTTDQLCAYSHVTTLYVTVAIVGNSIVSVTIYFMWPLMRCKYKHLANDKIWNGFFLALLLISYCRMCEGITIALLVKMKNVMHSLDAEDFPNSYGAYLVTMKWIFSVSGRTT